MPLRPLVVIASCLVLAGAGSARAETILTPYAGGVFGGDAEDTRGSFGLSLAFLGNVAGVELDLSHTPGFFGGEDELLGDNSVTTVMASLVIGPQFGDRGGRIYASGGAGLMKLRVTDLDEIFEVDDSELGVSVGGGILAPVGDNFAVRGDLRYFRSLGDGDEEGFDLDFGGFNYWRATGGLSFLF